MLLLDTVVWLSPGDLENRPTTDARAGFSLLLPYIVRGFIAV
jgi:hypothetical protein